MAATLLAATGLIAAGCSNDEEPGTGDQPATEPSVTVVAAADEVAVPGVSDTAVLFGQSAAFSGPAAELGTEMRLGIEAAFNEVNAQGGVHGRRLDLVSLDDAYEPDAAIANTGALINDEGVFALIGAVGTPTSRSAVPVAAAANVPYIAPFTGAAFLRDPVWDNVINLRASYNQETEEMVARLTGELGLERIAVLYQDDSFGRAGYRGARAALERRGMEPVALGLYPRNTKAVKTGLFDVRLGDPEAIIMIGAYAPVAEAIKWARYLDIDPVFMTISFVGANALAQALAGDGEGVLITQVVPFPTDRSIPVVASYLDALAVFDTEAEPGFVSLEGYIAGRLVIEGLQRCGRDLDRACLLDAFEQGEEMDIDGFELAFGVRDNQGSDSVFMTRIDAEGQHQPVETMADLAG